MKKAIVLQVLLVIALMYLVLGEALVADSVAGTAWAKIALFTSLLAVTIAAGMAITKEKTTADLETFISGIDPAIIALPLAVAVVWLVWLVVITVVAVMGILLTPPLMVLDFKEFSSRHKTGHVTRKQKLKRDFKQLRSMKAEALEDFLDQWDVVFPDSSNMAKTSSQDTDEEDF